MKQQKKIKLLIMVVLVLLSTMYGKKAYAAAISGSCGPAAKWSYDTTTKVLSITGSGEVLFTSWDDSNVAVNQAVKVVMSNQITYLPTSAFSNYKALQSVQFSDAITELPMLALSGCTALTSVHLPAKLTHLDEKTIAGCTSLKKLTIPKTFLVSKQSTFENTKLTEVVFEEGATQIPNYCFYNMDSLTKVTIPNSVTLIGTKSFYGCKNLAQFTMPSTLKYLGESCLYGCEKVKQIRIPKTFIEGKMALSGSFIEEVAIENGSSIISKKLFYKVTKLKKVVIPNSVTTIEEYAFEGCTSLAQVTLSQNLKIIEANAFRDCTSLTEISIPKTVQFCDNAFSNTGIKKMIFETGRENMPTRICGACSTVKEVVIPNTVKSISNSAFVNCSSLEKVVVTSSVVVVGYYAFTGCNKLTEISFKNPNTFLDLSWKQGSAIKTIYGIAGSTAESYAKSHNLVFVEKWRELKNCSITLPSTVEECGKVVTPQPIVKDGAATLVNGKDYTVSYKENKALGVATVTIKGTEEKYLGTITKTFRIIPGKNRTYTFEGLKYRVTNSRIDGKGTVSVQGFAKASTTVIIPKTVKIAGTTYVVTGIDKKAFYKKTKVTKVFIKSKTITSIGKKAFYRINDKAKIKVSASCYKKYAKLIKQSGIRKSVVIYK